MKPLTDLSILPHDHCARAVLETVPLLMRTIRQEMRQQRPAELSLPQFRTLHILQRHPGSSLSQLAARLDLTLASASKLIDVLVKHDLVFREASQTDRRKIVLLLTEYGSNTLATVEQSTHARLIDVLSALPEDEQQIITHAMHTLQSILEERGDEQ